MKGTVTGNGSRLYGDAYADADSEIGRRFKAAGLVTFGKTNTGAWAQHLHRAIGPWPDQKPVEPEPDGRRFQRRFRGSSGS